MDTKYVAAFLLVAVMITRIQYGSGEDCEKVKQCMVNSGITFQSVVLNPAATETLRKYFDILCSNIDALVSCYSTGNLVGCSALQSVFKQQSTADNMKALFTKVCAQREGIIGVVECFAKNGTLQSIQQCASSAFDTQSNNQGNLTLSCSGLSVIVRCTESPGQCSADAVSYIRSAYQERFDIDCAAPKMVVNVLLLCMLYMLNRFLLF